MRSQSFTKYSSYSYGTLKMYIKVKNNLKWVEQVEEGEVSVW